MIVAREGAQTGEATRHCFIVTPREATRSCVRGIGVAQEGGSHPPRSSSWSSASKSKRFGHAVHGLLLLLPLPLPLPLAWGFASGGGGGDGGGSTSGGC